MLGDPRSEAPPWQEKVTKAPPALKMLKHLDIDSPIFGGKYLQGKVTKAPPALKILREKNQVLIPQYLMRKVFATKSDQGATSAENVETLRYQFPSI